MPSTAVLGVDIGTSSSKGVIVDFSGRVLASTVREHEVSRPLPGHVEMDGEIWWQEFVSIASELTSTTDVKITAVGVSGMGPCVAVTDAENNLLRPAILYGVDTRAVEQITRLTKDLGEAEILERCGSALSTQAVGPKLAWIAETEPDIFARARRLFMPSSWLVHKLTDSYVLDHESASQCTPLYDTVENNWYEPWIKLIAPDFEFPKLVWANEIVGKVTAEAATLTGLPVGIPVVAGTIDAWAEAVSVGAANPGDLMLMYGTTMFLINTISKRITVPALWGTVGAFEGTRNLAGGMATSGAITGWLRKLFGSPSYPELLAAAEEAGPGAHGLLLLPYFAGERTPIADPNARGIIAGLSIEHTQGDLYRSALEAIALGVRHNIEAITEAGGNIERIVAVGGGTQGSLWTQIVSDVTGLPQQIATVTIGASYGAAFLAALAVQDVSIEVWNPILQVIEPNLELKPEYDDLYELYLELYPITAGISHKLAERQRGRS